jgi:DNA-binding SARP family transcriptional activator
VAEFRVLGPLEVALDGRPVPLPPGKPSALLAFLLLERNRVVASDRLVDGLWDAPPETAGKALQGYVSQLRRALGAERVETRPPGYSLEAGPEEVDLDRFEALVSEGRAALAAGDAPGAASALRAGLELWRGPPLAEFDEPFARDARRGLDEARVGAIEARVEAELTLGRHAEVVPELEQLIADEPYRERPRAQLMLALYRAGRQAEALELYRETRRTLSDELGIEPGTELQELEQAILRHDRTLEGPRRGRVTASGPPAERRRRLWPIGAAAAVAAVAIVVAVVALSTGSNGDTPLRPFVVKLENFLVQSREGRREVVASLRLASRCALPRQTVLVRLQRVQRNRQSLLDQIAALSVPDETGAAAASDRLQQAIQRSIKADGLYSDWIAAQRRCPPRAAAADLRAARAADGESTRAKQAFVASFNPLARRFGLEVWTPDEF